MRTIEARDFISVKPTVCMDRNGARLLKDLLQGVALIIATAAAIALAITVMQALGW